MELAHIITIVIVLVLLVALYSLLASFFVGQAMLYIGGIYASYQIIAANFGAYDFNKPKPSIWPSLIALALSAIMWSWAVSLLVSTDTRCNGYYLHNCEDKSPLTHPSVIFWLILSSISSAIGVSFFPKKTPIGSIKNVCGVDVAAWHAMHSGRFNTWLVELARERLRTITNLTDADSAMKYRLELPGAKKLSCMMLREYHLVFLLDDKCKKWGPQCFEQHIYYQLAKSFFNRCLEQSIVNIYKEAWQLSQNNEHTHYDMSICDEILSHELSTDNDMVKHCLAHALNLIETNYDIIFRSVKDAKLTESVRKAVSKQNVMLYNLIRPPATPSDFDIFVLDYFLQTNLLYPRISKLISQYNSDSEQFIARKNKARNDKRQAIVRAINGPGSN